MLAIVPTLLFTLSAASIPTVRTPIDSTPVARAMDTSTIKLDMDVVKKLASTAAAFDTAAKTHPFTSRASTGNPQGDMAAAIDANVPVAAVVKQGGFTAQSYAKAYFTLFSAWGMLDARRQLEGRIPDITQVRLPGVTDENFNFVKAHEQEFVKLGLKAPHATIPNS